MKLQTVPLLEYVRVQFGQLIIFTLLSRSSLMKVEGAGFEVHTREDIHSYITGDCMEGIVYLLSVIL